MVRDERKICEASRDQRRARHIDPKYARQTLRLYVACLDFQIVRVRVEVARCEHEAKTDHSRNQEGGKCQLIASTPGENRGDQQWAEQRAKLVQCFMYTEGPPKPNLTTGMREHRVARGIACRPAEAFENNQCGGHRPIIRQR